MPRSKTLTLILALIVSACSTLPDAGKPPEDSHLPAARTGILAEASATVNTSGDSAFLLLNRADEAMRWRLAMVDSAEQSIDMQYFIWKDDASASLLLERVFAAADRGVSNS